VVGSVAAELDELLLDTADDAGSVATPSVTLAAADAVSGVAAVESVVVGLASSMIEFPQINRFVNRSFHHERHEGKNFRDCISFVIFVSFVVKN
jgi:hypothetical protein